MRNPKVVLDSLASKSTVDEYKYQRLYRNLYNEEFFLMAYSKIYANEGNMTKGTDGKTIDGMSMERIKKLIEKLKDQTYQPNPSKRTYIKKTNGKDRPLGIPSFDDKLVQEVVRSILESIHEKKFSRNSHGFRPDKSCHTALMQVQREFRATRWFVEGDIKGFFDNIDHHVLIGILRKYIDDEKFINLIWKFLKAGYLQDWKYHKTYSGTPQGGIISPILSNIYLNELDSYVAEYMEKFKIGIGRETNPEYTKWQKKSQWLRDKNKSKWDQYDEQKKAEIIREYKELKRKAMSVPSKKIMDSSFRNMQYVRYADDFLIGIIGTKADAIKIKDDLTVFLAEKLKLELSQEKTLITNTKKFARFLGYDIAINRTEHVVTKQFHGRMIKAKHSLQVVLYVPKEKWIGKLQEFKILKIKEDNSWKALHRPYLSNCDDLEIIRKYNAELTGFYNYYKLANNVSVLNKFHYIMEMSMLKTFANKYKTSTNKIWNKYQINGRFGVKYKTKKGEKIALFNEKTYHKNRTINTKKPVDDIPNTEMYTVRTSLIERLLADECEWCGNKNSSIQIHHIRKLKDLKGKKAWEKFMIARNRKTMALCRKCHKDLHAGKLDG
ncbi:reverse transcriptase domain-containing protein [Domibacillus sp. 8LH]|uniref:reverse transcriptase/maturase family protein n=1 Tax=Domibacillus sp. 8LH TaxID=3073900 RepID=UPI00317F64CB